MKFCPRLTILTFFFFATTWQRIEACIFQNKAVNIYDEYFHDLEPAPIVDRSTSHTMFVYKDVETPTVIIAAHVEPLDPKE